MSDLIKFGVGRLTEKSTWISIFGLFAMLNIGLDPQVVAAVGEQAPVIVGGVWALAQSLMPESGKE